MPPTDDDQEPEPRPERTRHTRADSPWPSAVGRGDRCVDGIMTDEDGQTTAVWQAKHASTESLAALPEVWSTMLARYTADLLPQSDAQRAARDSILVFLHSCLYMHMADAREPVSANINRLLRLRITEAARSRPGTCRANNPDHEPDRLAEVVEMLTAPELVLRTNRAVEAWLVLDSDTVAVMGLPRGASY